MVRYNQPLQGPYFPLQGNQMICAYVQGEAAAKAYPIAPGQFAILLDSEKNAMYTKTTDGLGRPLPIRIFDYAERIQTPDPVTENENYVSKSDFDNFKNEIREMLKNNQNKQNNYKKQPDREEQK